MPEQDPLAALVVDETEMAREELAGVLEPFVRFTRTGALVLQEGFDRLTALKRTCCVLLAIRAVHLLGMRETPGAAPRELVSASGMAPGSVRPSLSRLVQQRIAVKLGEEYSVPAFAVRRAALLIRGDADG